MRISDWSSDVCSSDLNCTSSRARTIRPIRTRSASCGRQSQRCKGVRRMNEMTELASICTSDLTQTAGLGTGPVSCEPYRSPAYFERERENLFKRAWLTVGRVEQLPEKGSFFTKTIEIWNAPIVVTRGSDDRIQAFYNVCA